MSLAAAQPPAGADDTAPTVTVVIPSCGRPSLRQALRSALGQRGVAVDVVVVDDSGHGAARASGADLDDRRVRVVVHRRREGVSRSRNDGIRAASGEWVAFLDDDDVWAPHKLASQIGAAGAGEADWAYSGVAAVDDDLRCLTVEVAPVAADVVRDLPVRNAVPATASNVVVRRSALLRTGLFDTCFRHLGDWDLVVRLAADAGPPAVVAEPQVGYRIHSAGASSDNADLPAELDRFRRKHGAESHGRAIDRAEVWRWMAASSLRAGHRWKAARSYARAALAGDLAAVPRAVVAALDPMASRHALAIRRRGDPALARIADRWLTELRPPLDRPRRPEPELRIAADERMAPSPDQWDYLHLRGLRDGLVAAIASLRGPAGPALDLYCGVKPYAGLVTAHPLWGVDVDLHFGRADVLGRNELPFADGAFSLVLCSQALILVDDDVRTVEEVRRVLTPGGSVVMTVPHLYRRTTPWERRYSVAQLEQLFATFEGVEIRRADSLGAAGAYVVGTLLRSLALRSTVVARRLPPVLALVNRVGDGVDRLLGPLGRRFPHSLILVARRPG